MRIGRRRVDAEAELNMPPGFRFYPTDEELVVHYLCRKVAKQGIPVPIIADVDLYKYDPWDLPEMALFGQREWYFFTPRDRKYPNGSRPNRAAGRGYWKATGADKHISPSGSNRPLGIKKALVFYNGKAPKGIKTDWIMHEYRLANNNDNRNASTKKGTLRLDDWVLCRLYNKKNAWEKKLLQEQQQPQEAEDDSDSFRTLESDVELPDCGEVHAFNPPPAAAGSEHHQELKPVKEDNDWFQDLNLDDLHNSFGSFQSVPGLQIPPNADYYFPGVNGSPFPRTGYNPLPF